MSDLLLTNAYVLTMDQGGTQYPNGFVAVTGAEIERVGPMTECPDAGQAGTLINCSGCAVIPGLINSHTHLAMNYFRGLADDLPLETWLAEHIWPAEARHLNSEFVYQASLFAAAECIKSGVTCVNDMYLFAADVARACNDAGLRAYIGKIGRFPVSDCGPISYLAWRGTRE